MTRTTKNILMTASVAVMMAMSVPAMADPAVLCSVRANYNTALSEAGYKPGVDVRGNAVVGADINEPVRIVQHPIVIPFSIDLAARLNEVLPAGAKLDATIGVVQIDENGRVIIDGQDLTQPVTAMCGNIEKQKAAAARTQDVKRAQKPAVAKPAAPTVQAAPAPAVAAPESVPAPVVDNVPADDEIVETSPQVLQPSPAEPVLEPTPEVPAPAPFEPALDEIAPAPAPEALSPSEADLVLPPDAGLVPRAPVDPLTGAEAIPPVPAPIQNDAGGMLSGGAQ